MDLGRKRRGALAGLIDKLGERDVPRLHGAVEAVRVTTYHADKGLE